MSDTEQQGVSPTSAGGASAPDPNAVDNALAGTLIDQYGFLPLSVRFSAAAAARAVTESWTRSRPVPDAEILPADRKPVHGEPGIQSEWDEDTDAMRVDGIGWSLSWGCKLSIARDHDTGEHYVCVNTSGEDQRRGIVSRSTTREQIASFGQQLLNVFGEPDPRDAEIERLREVVEARNEKIEQLAIIADKLEGQRDEAREQAGAANADMLNALASRNRFVAQATDLAAERDRLRQELDLQHADRLRWLCDALNVNPANETWLTATRRVRHLRQNFSDSPRCEVSESDGWRCRLFAGHDGKHLAQMPTGERREWPFDNRLTPRYWRAGDPEPEIGTTVRYVNHAAWPTQTRRTDGQWHCDAGTHDPNTCTESELYSWEQITARSELMPLVEVAANSKAGA